MKPQVDYSLYLVTDSTDAILGKRDLVDVVEQALLGGVTVVQYRDKTSDTRVLIETARALHKKCKEHSIPLIINDRVDVALAVGCEGVHLGQNDMDVLEARNILGPSKIIGATVSSIEEAKVAVDRGADYLGVGTLYATNTKKNTKDIIGITGIRKILHFLEHQAGSEAAKGIKTVCIGGINATNIQRVLYQLTTSASPTSTIKPIDGVAIVSAIIASPEPKQASSHLKSLISSRPTFLPSTHPSPQPSSNTNTTTPLSLETLLPSLLSATKAVHATKPLSHNMTNLVVQNFAANVALSIGASPIMSNNGGEAADLAALQGGLVINMGTPTPEALHQHRLAIQAYNAVGGPIVLDPVGAGATTARRSAVKYLLESGYFTVIKGNEAEIMAVASETGLPSLPEDKEQQQQQQQKGVDSSPTSLPPPLKASLVTRLAHRERTLILMTGATDILSDGTHTALIYNGHDYLGLVTGTGCTLGTAVSAYLAAAAATTNSSTSPSSNVENVPNNGRINAFTAVLAALLHFEIAAEDAAGDGSVKGPGSFVPGFLDKLSAVREGVVAGQLDRAWLEGRMMVELVK